MPLLLHQVAVVLLDVVLDGQHEGHVVDASLVKEDLSDRVAEAAVEDVDLEVDVRRHRVRVVTDQGLQIYLAFDGNFAVLVGRQLPDEVGDVLELPAGQHRKYLPINVEGVVDHEVIADFEVLLLQPLEVEVGDERVLERGLVQEVDETEFLVRVPARTCFWCRR